MYKKIKKKLKTWISVVLHFANATRAHLHRCYVLCSDSFDQRCGVGILRWREGLDRSPAKLTVVGGMHHTYLSFSTISLCLLHCSVPSKCFFAEWSHIAHIIFYCTWEQFWLEAPSKQLYFWLLYKPACVSQHYQLRAGGFILERSFAASSPCWWKLGAFVFGDSCWSSMILF